MPWYRTGTVAITAGQTTVTGTGTNFSANGRVGDALLAPDGNWYEVTNIASGTVLSILPAYKGATVSGGTYAITPVQGYTKTLADKFNDIATNWGSTLAGLGTVSTENVVPLSKGGTGSTTAAGALSALGLTLPTANLTDGVTDFNSLTSSGWQAKLYSYNNANAPGTLGNAVYYYVFNVVFNSNLTQIAIPYGSSGTYRGRICLRSHYQGIWFDWQKCLSQLDIVGAVSQSGGVATGAIIERGSNANGQYTKYADGTMECWSQVQAVYVQADLLSASWSFPAPFNNNVSVQVTPIQGSVADMAPNWRDLGTAMAASLSLSSCAPRVWLSRGATASFASGNFINLGCFAKGRWF